MTHYIAGDWGTSNLRLYLCQAGTGILESRSGPGVIAARDDFESAFFGLAGDWFDEHGAVPVILSGMVGSSLGWREAPYTECPIEIDSLAGAHLRFACRGIEISILGGLRTTNPLGLPDVLRGEELQILGWARQHHGERTGKQLLGLPGTHNKWVVIEGSRVRTFVTAMSGELFGLLKDHSVLLGESDYEHSDTAFGQGLDVAKSNDAATFMHALFSTRSGALLGDIDAASAESYLSGLIIGADVRGALDLLAPTRDASIDLIGAPDLCRRYEIALSRWGIDAVCHDPDAIAQAGYEMVHAAIVQGEAA